MTTYSTRISVGLFAYIVVTFLLIAIAPLFFGHNEWPFLLLYYGSIGITFVFAIWALCSSRYTIDGTSLMISSKFSPFSPDVYDLTKLVSVVPTRSLMSAPAGSLKRIELTFSDGNTVIISPRRQDDFLMEVRKANPKVRIDTSLM